jgi:hypothetical protein
MPSKYGGLSHVGGLVVPGEGLALRQVHAFPALVTGEDVAVALGEHLGLHTGVHHLFDLLG